jgi:HlyD family type I secretion membrane fusion protein
VLAASQTDVLNQRIQQLNTRIVGTQAQVDSIDEQQRLIGEELSGLKELNAKGFAPTNRVRQWERTAASLGGQRGAQVAEISRSNEAIGEARIELAKVRQERVGEAAEALRQIEVRMAELLPKLRAAEEAYRLTKVIAPVDGYVLNLTQFTEGGVTGAGETLMDVVPANAPLLIDARVRPQDADNIEPGMEARVRLSGLSRRLNNDLMADVVSVSADRKVDQHTGEPFFSAQVRIRPQELKKLSGKHARIHPGMPADTYILTGERTVLDYVVGPLRDALNDSLREE